MINRNGQVSYHIWMLNNLYGLAMCKKLPLNNFKWHYNKIDEKKIMKYSDDDDVGYILEVE